MIGSFQIHVAGLIVVIAGILLFVILSIVCLVTYGLIPAENKQAHLWAGALMRSAFLLAASQIILSFPLMIIFGTFYEKLAHIYKFDYEKTKDLYDEYLFYGWTILLVIVWILIKNFGEMLWKGDCKINDTTRKNRTIIYENGIRRGRPGNF